jgi:hypothetical protein
VCQPVCYEICKALLLVFSEAMAQFSGAVKLADLNDFIAPSQACVVKLDGNKDGAITLDSKPEVTGRSEVRLQIF